MKGVDRGMPLALREIESTAFKRLNIGGGVQNRLGFLRGQARELSQEFGSALGDQPGQLRFMIGKKQKRAGSRELLPLEQHRRAWGQELQGGQGFQSARTRQNMTTQPAPGVGNLIVIL